MEQWQLELWNKLAAYDSQSHPNVLYVVGRRTGKSVYARMLQDILSRSVEDLILSETRYNGSRYYLVEPIGGSWVEMEIWCTQTFGEQFSPWGGEPGRWAMNDRKFWFREEKDRNWFVMRWSR